MHGMFFFFYYAPDVLAPLMLPEGDAGKHGHSLLEGQLQALHPHVIHRSLTDQNLNKMSTDTCFSEEQARMI